MLHLLDFALFIISPAPWSGLDVLVLALLGPAAKKDHNYFSIFPKINPISRPKIYAAFENPGTDTFHIREITLLNPHQRSCDLSRRWSI
jgi:hypothetical protein